MASITKPITATAAMILVEEGALGLNCPVSDYLPEFRGEGKDAVMVHHLLTHTSGLHNEEVRAHAEKNRNSIEIPVPEETQHPAINEYLALRYQAPLWKTPGVEMSYCNYGYVLLGEIVRRVSGTSLDNFARERIFAPLGMTDTFYAVPESVRHRIVRRPPDAPHAQLDSREWQDTPWFSSGVFSTARDMAIFGQMFLNGGSYGGSEHGERQGRILSPAGAAAMVVNQIPSIGARYEEEIFPEASWGFGWNVHGSKKEAGSLLSPRAFSHSGGGGVSLWADPVYEIVGVCFSVDLGLVPEGSTKSCTGLFMDEVMAAMIDE